MDTILFCTHPNNIALRTTVDQFESFYCALFHSKDSVRTLTTLTFDPKLLCSVCTSSVPTCVLYPSASLILSTTTNATSTTNTTLDQARRGPVCIRCRPRLFCFLRGEACAGAGAESQSHTIHNNWCCGERQQQQQGKSWRRSSGCSGARNRAAQAFRGRAWTAGRHCRGGSSGGSALVVVVRDR